MLSQHYNTKQLKLPGSNDSYDTEPWKWVVLLYSNKASK